MPVSIRFFRRFPVQGAVTYNVGPFLKLPLAYCLGLWLLITLLLLSSAPVYADWWRFTQATSTIRLIMWIQTPFVATGIW
jgi:hypothetical protein